MTPAELLALANEEAQTGTDMTEMQAGGGGRRLLPEGYGFGILVGYVELGNQPQEYQKEKKDPAPEFFLEFAMVQPGYANDDGTPYVVRTYDIAQHRNDKAQAFKAFSAMNYTGDAKTFAQLLGRPFFVKFKHKPGKDAAGKEVVRSNIDLVGTLPPLDNLSKSVIPANHFGEIDSSLFKLFLWNKPTIACWDMLKVEGVYAAKDGKPAESKNKVQEKILGALNFQGSPLQLLLAGGLPTLPTGDVADTAGIAEAKAQAQATVAANPTVGPAVTVAVAPAAVPTVNVPSTPSPAVPSTAPASATSAPAPAVAATPVAPSVSPVVAPATAPVLPV